MRNFRLQRDNRSTVITPFVFH